MGLEGEVLLRDGAADMAEEEELAVLPRPLVEHLRELDQYCQLLTSIVSSELIQYC